MHRLTGTLTALVLLAWLDGASYAQDEVGGVEAPSHEEVFMTMRDGIKLAANVFKPEGAGPWAVIVTRTPYLKAGDMMVRGGSK